MSDWISVDERLPEPHLMARSEWVIVYKMPVVFVAAYNHDWDNWTVWGGGIIHGITHWMPLPAPPEEANDAHND